MISGFLSLLAVTRIEKQGLPLNYLQMYEYLGPLSEYTLGWLRVSCPDLLCDMVVKTC